MTKFYSHKKINLLLYEFHLNELSPGDMKMVEEHCRSCRRCSDDLAELRSAIGRISFPEEKPAESLPPEYWRQFIAGVDRRIGETAPVTGFTAEWENLMTWLVGRRRWVYGLSGAVAAIILLVMFWKPVQPPPPTVAVQTPNETAVQRPAGYDSAEIAEVRSRATEYFRKSKALLVGLSNKKVSIRTPADFSAEQQVSRQLVHEARYLKQQPLDIRSTRLIDDMDRIFIELANTGGNNAAPDVELIRSGIQRANLLFKIRMAEAEYDTANGFYAGRPR